MLEVPGVVGKFVSLHGEMIDRGKGSFFSSTLMIIMGFFTIM